MNPREKLRQLAPCATVGIGGVPSRELAFEFDVPTLPELVGDGETLRGLRPASWPWFVEQLRVRRAKFAKVQVPGPASGQRDATEQALGYVKALKAINVEVLVFIDEPMLAAGASVEGVLPLRDALRDVGAIVGLHCCGDADWAHVLAADFDIVSFDARLSLHAVTQERLGDTWLAVGVVPTSPGPKVDVDGLLTATSGTDRVLLSPACGLGGFDALTARAVLGELRRVQSLVRERSAHGPG